MKNALNQLGTLLTVTIVTVLVWLYAEDANIQEYTGETVRVQFVLPPGIDGRLTPSEPITVTLDFDGSNGQYQQFDDARDEVIDIELPIDGAQDLQDIPLNLRDALEQADRLSALGINVTNVTSDYDSVRFEKVGDLTLDVKIRQRTGEINLADARFTNPEEQSSVTLKDVPAGIASQSRSINAIAWIDEENVAAMEKGEQKQITVSLELPGALADFDRSFSTVDLFVTTANDRDTVTIGGRPVLLSYAASINERYTITFEEGSLTFINAIELEGPSEQIALIKANPNTKDVWASVRLTNDEVDAAANNRGIIPKDVEIHTPDGVAPASTFEVRIKVTPKEAPEPLTP